MTEVYLLSPLHVSISLARIANVKKDEIGIHGYTEETGYESLKERGTFPETDHDFLKTDHN